MSAFTILENFSKVRNVRNSFYPCKENESPITNRVTFIIDYLLDNKLKFKLDIFPDASQRPIYKGRDFQNKPIFDWIDVAGQYVNIEVEFKATQETAETIIFVAHHDINNVNSQNVQDNTASVSNLLQFATELSNIQLNKNIYVVFTDCEEFGGRGADRLSQRIIANEFGQVKYVVNLELTANGTELWADWNGGELSDKLLMACAEQQKNLNIFKTPFNDSHILRKYNIPSICIGLLSPQEVISVNQKGYCKTWGVCHKENDTLEQANEGEMGNFIQNILHKLI